VASSLPIDLRLHDGCYHKRHCVKEPLVSRPQTRTWLVSPTRVADVTDALAPQFNSGHSCGSYERSHKTLCYSSGLATRKCPSDCWATAAVAQPLSVVSEMLRKIEWHGRRRQLRVPWLSGACGSNLRVHDSTPRLPTYGCVALCLIKHRNNFTSSRRPTFFILPH
jgi:hypothetical protein